MSDRYVVTDRGARIQDELGKLSTRKLSRFLEQFEDFFLFFFFLLALVFDRIALYDPLLDSKNALPCPQNLDKPEFGISTRRTWSCWSRSREKPRS